MSAYNSSNGSAIELAEHSNGSIGPPAKSQSEFGLNKTHQSSHATKAPIDKITESTTGLTSSAAPVVAAAVPDAPATTENEAEDYGARPPYFKTTLTECLFVLTTTVAVGANSVFNGAILVMSAHIGTALSMSSAEVSWLYAAQNLAGGAFLLLFGRVADLFGRRWLLIAALASYTVFLIIAGFATNAVYVDVMSGLLGVSCAAAVPPALGKLGGVYRNPSWRKNRAFACFSAGYPVGFVLGGWIAGVAIQVADWRAAFWAMGVLYAMFTVAAWWTVPLDTEQSLGGWNWETVRQFDLLGAALTIAGMGMFTASFTLTGDSQGGWKSAYVLVLLLVGLALIGGFLYWQSVCKSPLMPLGVFKDRNFSILVFALCVGNMSFGGNLFWNSLLWQRVEKQSPLMVAVRLLPAGIFGIVVNIVAGLAMHRVSNKLLMIVGTVALVGASALWSATSPGLTYWELSFPALILSVIGVDFQFTVTNMYVLSSMKSDQQSVAGGMFNTVARVFATIGTGIQTAVYEGAGGEAEGPGSLKYRAYQATFWFSLGTTVLGLMVVPWLTIGTQGQKKKTP